MTTIVSLLRCIVSMAISASDLEGDVADKVRSRKLQKACKRRDLMALP